MSDETTVEEPTGTLADALVSEDEDDEVTYHHRISIPGADLEDVIDACMDIELEQGRITKNITIYEGSPVRTVDVEYESHDEAVKDMAYRLGRIFNYLPVFLLNGEVWENTHTILRS